MYKFVVAALLVACAFASSSSSGSDVHTFTPEKEKCSYHEYTFLEEDGDYYEDWVMLKDPSTGYLSMINKTSGDKEIIRCDKKNEKGECAYVVHHPDGSCDKYYTDKSEYWLDMDFQFTGLSEPFQYVGEGKSVTCPDFKNLKKSRESKNYTYSHCVEYCNTTDEEDEDRACVIVDTDTNTYVKTADNVYVQRTFDEVTDMSVFATYDCKDGKRGDEWKAPENVCSSGSGSSQKGSSSHAGSGSKSGSSHKGSSSAPKSGSSQKGSSSAPKSGSDSGSKSSASSVVASAVVLVVAALVALF